MDILIAGCGVSGQAAARLASRLGISYGILDEKDTPELHGFCDSLGKPPELTLFGWKSGTPIPVVPTVVLSPGIRETNPLFQALHDAAPERISELDFALRNLKVPFVGITGTNGKTTTTELTAELFKAAGVRAAACGNIGYAASAAAIDSLDGKLDVAVIEISSFQLEPMKSIHPAAAAVLNLASDHLDRHGSMDAYAAIKFKLLAGLPPDKGIVNANLKNRKQARPFVSFSAADAAADFAVKDNALYCRNVRCISCADLALEGPHNMENILAALALVCAVKGPSVLSKPELLDKLKSFRPAPHRLECFLTRNGVRFIDDSKATNPHAVNAAVAAVAKGRNVLLLLGGLDKGMDFRELSVSMPSVKKVFLFGQCRKTIEAFLPPEMPRLSFDRMQDAALAACSEAVPGETVLLSPATASFDEFKSYAHRGSVFQQVVTGWANA